MAELDLGKVRMTDTELMEKIITANGGVRFGKDAEGRPGFIETDAETGEETVIPFGSGGGGGIEEFEVLNFTNSASTGSGSQQITLNNIAVDKNYKHILIVVAYYRPSVSYNTVTDIEISQTAGSTLETLQMYYTSKNLTWYMGCCLYGAVNEGENLSFKALFKTSNGNSNTKSYFIAAIGLN